MSAPSGLASTRPVLHLSAGKLRIALQRLVAASEPLGGVERFAEAVRLKSVVFQERLLDGKSKELSRAAFEEIVPLMATVRRRAAPLLDGRSWPTTQLAITALFEGATTTTTADTCIASFESDLRSLLEVECGQERRANHRFLRDLASELLHNALPEHYPLMHRWIWDSRTNTGVIRQIWHDPNGAGDEVDHIVIDVPDRYETHLVLREELSQFLSENGVFRDMLWHVDLLCAQIYGDYVSAQGSAYLKADFTTEGDMLEHSRRILGLDRTAGKPARKRLIDGTAAPVPATKLIP